MMYTCCAHRPGFGGHQKSRLPSFLHSWKKPSGLNKQNLLVSEYRPRRYKRFLCTSLITDDSQFRSKNHNRTYSIHSRQSLSPFLAEKIRDKGTACFWILRIFLAELSTFHCMKAHKMGHMRHISVNNSCEHKTNMETIGTQPLHE